MDKRRKINDEKTNKRSDLPRKLRLVPRGEFSIVKATVSYKVRNERVKGCRGTFDAIYFVEHGRIISSETTFYMTSEGDGFYLVILHNKKKDIALAYSMKTYECKDVDLAS